MRFNNSIRDIEIDGGSAHLSVLASELVELLQPQSSDTVIDCTFGAGGHAGLIAARLGPEAQFIGIDRDPLARRYFDLFAQHQPFPLRFIQGNFAPVLAELAASSLAVNVIYMDLGVSSMQLDQPERGFSYSQSAPLDMRMDPEGRQTAADLVNQLPEAELARIFKLYGEERYARQIARRIGRERKKGPLTSTTELVDIVKAAIPTPARFGAGHPARRVFQALRIAVNDELTAVEEGLASAFKLLAPGGRLGVISFHSLEDRIVKQFFAGKLGKCTCPPDLPQCVCKAKAELRLITRRPVKPSVAEMEANPRSQSAKLRVAEKLA